MASFDLYEFFKKDVGEKNIAELFGALGITTAKLFLSGVITAVLLGTLLVSLSAVGVVLSASLLLLSIAGLSFAVGWSVDSIDSYLGLKDRVKRTLKDAFPHLTIENMIQKEIDFHEGKVNSYIGSSAMQGSGFYGF